MRFNIHYSKQSFYDFYQRNMFHHRSWCRKEYNRAWRVIAKGLNGKQAFEKIWQNIKDDSPRARRELTKNIKKHKIKIGKIIKILGILYKKPLSKNFEFDVCLILLPKGVQSGGGHIDLKKNTLYLEGSLERLQKPRTVEILLHELIHLYFEQGHFKNELYQKFKDKIDYSLLKEIIACSLLPNGYLSEKYFGSKIMKLKPDKLILIAKEYINAKKPFDENYIRQAIKAYAKIQKRK